MSKLRTFAERIERLHEEKRSIEEDIREVYAELAAEGYDKKAMREVIKRRSKDPQEAGEFEAIVDLYLQEINAPSRVHTRDARDTREAAESSAAACALSGNASLDRPVETIPGGHDVDRSASAQPHCAKGEPVIPFKAGDAGTGQASANDTSTAGQPSGAGTGSDVRTVAPIVGARESKPLRPHCKAPGNCGGYGSTHCFRCRPEAA